MSTHSLDKNPVLPQTARIHLGWLDSLRALAALYVVVGHAVSIVWPQAFNFRNLTLATAGPFRYGHSAVGLFIVLSGFSLMIPVTRTNEMLRGGAWTFFGRRAKRILPPYYAALTVSGLLIYTLLHQKTGSCWDLAIPVTKLDIWTHLFMLQDIFSRPKIDSPLWSISVEWRIYFFFPFFIVLFGRWGGGKVVLGVLAASFLALVCIQRSGFTMLYGIMPVYYTLFTIGMLACEVGLGNREKLCKLRDQVPWLTLACPLLLLYMILLYKWRGNVSEPHLFLQDVVGGVLWAVVLISVSKPGKNVLREYLSWRPLVFIGTFAYSIYLIHMPLLQLVWQYCLHPHVHTKLMTYLCLVLFGVPLVVGLSYLFFLAFERPFLNTKKHETMGETARDAALSPAP